jgi:hypothetical protein
MPASNILSFHEYT